MHATGKEIACTLHRLTVKELYRSVRQACCTEQHCTLHCVVCAFSLPVFPPTISLFLSFNLSSFLSLSLPLSVSLFSPLPLSQSLTLCISISLSLSISSFSRINNGSSRSSFRERSQKNSFSHSQTTIKRTESSRQKEIEIQIEKSARILASLMTATYKPIVLIQSIIRMFMYVII